MSVFKNPSFLQILTVLLYFFYIFGSDFIGNDGSFIYFKLGLNYSGNKIYSHVYRNLYYIPTYNEIYFNTQFQREDTKNFYNLTKLTNIV